MLNTFCPGLGSNQDLLRGSQTLYRVAIKAGLYRKAVQVRIIPNITTLTLLCVVQLGEIGIHLRYYAFPCYLQLKKDQINSNREKAVIDL